MSWEEGLFEQSKKYEVNLAYVNIPVQKWKENRDHRILLQKRVKEKVESEGTPPLAK